MITTDITLAAFAVINGARITKIERFENRGTFHLDTSNVSDEALRNYDLGCATVEPKRFHAEIRNLTSSVKRQQVGA